MWYKTYLHAPKGWSLLAVNVAAMAEYEYSYSPRLLTFLVTYIQMHKPIIQWNGVCKLFPVQCYSIPTAVHHDMSCTHTDRGVVYVNMHIYNIFFTCPYLKKQMENVNDAAFFFDANTELNMQKHLSMFLTWKAGHLSIMPALRTTWSLYSGC